MSQLIRLVGAFEKGAAVLLMGGIALAADAQDARGVLVAAVLQQDSAQSTVDLEAAVRGDGQDAFLVLAEGGIPGPWLGPPGKPVRLGSTARGELRSAFLQQDHEWLRSFFSQLAREEARVPYRTKALDLLGDFAVASDLRLLVRLANPLRPEGGQSSGRAVRLPRAHREALRRALSRVLTRDIGAYPLLVSLCPELDPCLVTAAIDSFRESRTALGLESLARLLDLVEVPEAYVLKAMEEVARGVGTDSSEQVAAPVRVRIESQDPFLAVTAARTAAHLRDWAAVEPLMESVRSENPSVRQGAGRALEELTTLRYGISAELWQRWYAEETRWWRVERPQRLMDLESPRPECVLAAISSYAKHRLFRDELALELLPSLSRPEVLIVVQACAALGELKTREVLPEIIPLLHDADIGIREAALRTLRRVTGKNIPANEGAWRRELGVAEAP